MHTELRIEGANCPTCLNATLDALRQLPGVDRVALSSASGCLAIDHAGVDQARLADVIRDRLHGVTTYGAELVMVSVDPLVADLHCSHGGAHEH